MIKNDPTFESEKFKKIHLQIKDTIGGSPLILRLSESGYPHSYSRRIKSAVCMEEECRPVDIILFWSFTGRYLGFEIPDGEFLSKTDHVKFEPEDYYRLHQLLENPFSALKEYEAHELVPEYEDEVDGVTSATIPGVTGYIVEDAVYTTYTIWHLVYGSIQNEIRKETEARISDGLIMKALESSYEEDISWGLDILQKQGLSKDILMDQVIKLTQHEQFYVSEQAIETLGIDYLNDESNQMKLYSGFEDAPFLVKRKNLGKLAHLQKLNLEIEKTLSEDLNAYSGSLIKDVLELFLKHSPQLPETELRIAKLMDHRNKFIARKAYQYFDGKASDNKKVNRMIKKYKSSLK